MAESVFITGADKGLGASLAATFLQAGWRVFAGLLALGPGLPGIEEGGDPMLVSVPLDVTSEASVRSAAEFVAVQTTGLDLLINNAGIFLSDTEPLEELDLSDGRLERTMDVNAYGPLRVAQQFLPLLAKGTRKRIVNISSEAGSVGDCRRQSWFAYCMSKAALNMQSKILQNYLGLQGFTVLVLHPGWMRTEMGGPDADIHPDEAASAIFGLATAPCAVGDPMYMDYRGNPLPW